MHNVCFTGNKIPKIWRQSKIIAILMAGKASAIPKNYRPISLLCHIYKLYKQMILNRISPVVEERLIKEQSSFSTRKSCNSQLLNLTQHIEDGYQRGMITGAAFVDLSTVNHRILIQKLQHNSQQPTSGATVRSSDLQFVVVLLSTHTSMLVWRCPSIL